MARRMLHRLAVLLEEFVLFLVVSFVLCCSCCAGPGCVVPVVLVLIVLFLDGPLVDGLGLWDMSWTLGVE
jgi:hypothetical protein